MKRRRLGNIPIPKVPPAPAVEHGSNLFATWMPGQVPGGKNQQALIRDPQTGTMRKVPRRRDKGKGRRRTGTLQDDREPFERWRDPLVQALELVKPPRPYGGMVRLLVSHWWGDEIDRDEDGRSGAIGHVLQNAGIVHDDKLLRTIWLYMGLDRERPGVLVEGWAERKQGGTIGIPMGRMLGVKPEELKHYGTGRTSAPEWWPVHKVMGDRRIRR